MYCPNCATPITGTKFCRTCGANVSQVSQALTGQLPAQGLSKAEKPPSIERAAGSFFSGLAFILVSFSVFFFRAGRKNLVVLDADSRVWNDRQRGR